MKDSGETTSQFEPALDGKLEVKELGATLTFGEYVQQVNDILSKDPLLIKDFLRRQSGGRSANQVSLPASNMLLVAEADPMVIKELLLAMNFQQKQQRSGNPKDTVHKQAMYWSKVETDVDVKSFQHSGPIQVNMDSLTSVEYPPAVLKKDKYGQIDFDLR